MYMDEAASKELAAKIDEPLDFDFKMPGITVEEFYVTTRSFAPLIHPEIVATCTSTFTKDSFGRLSTAKPIQVIGEDITNEVEQRVKEIEEHAGTQALEIHGPLL